MYEDNVIREATLQLAPQLPSEGGFPDLTSLAGDTATLWTILTRTQRRLNDPSQAPEGEERDSLLLKEQVILHYLSTCGGVPEDDLPKRRFSVRRLTESATTANEREDENDQKIPSIPTGPLPHRRVSMMERKLVQATASDVLNDHDEEATAKAKDELRRLRKERLERRAQRRHEWSSCSSSSDDEREFDEEPQRKALSATTAERSPPSRHAARIAGPAIADQSQFTAVCPLCNSSVVVSSKDRLDEALAAHMNDCQRRGTRPSRRSFLGSPPSRSRCDSPLVSQSVVTQTSENQCSDVRSPSSQTARPRKKRRTKKARPSSFHRTEGALITVDDYHEASYEERVDDWIEHGLDRMKDMMERDADEELPGAQNYEGLHIPAWLNDRLFGYQRVALHWMWDLHLQEAGGILGYVVSFSCLLILEQS